MNGAPALSVIIPTYRRPGMLAKALQSIARSEGIPGDEAEVIVVDNNSGDKTRDTVEQISLTFPFRLEYVLETTPGRPAACNAGARTAKGDYFIFMDDDQQMDERYLARVRPGFAETHADCLGGRVIYVDAETFPRWLRIVIRRFGQRDFGPEIRQLTNSSGGLLGGGNLIAKRAMFERMGGFNVAILKTQDLEFQERLLRGGGTIYYDPSLLQHHYLVPERLKRRYFLKRSFESGQNAYRAHAASWADMPRLFGIPRFMLRKVVDGAARFFTSLAAPSDQRFDYLCQLASSVGAVYEAATRGGGRS